MTALALSILLTSNQFEPHLGYIGLIQGLATIVRNDRSPAESFTPQLLGKGKKVGLGPGDVVIVPKGCGVKGVYDSRTLWLLGPRQWTAPKLGDFNEGDEGAGPILGKKGMGDPQARQGVFDILGSTPKKELDVYIERDGVLRLAWVAEPEVKSIHVSVEVGGRTLGPYDYLARADSPDKRIGWIADKSLGTRLRSVFMSEEDKVTATFAIRVGAGEPIFYTAKLIRKKKAREFDSTFEAMRKAMAQPDLAASIDWFEPWNICLRKTEKDLPAATAFWVVQAWWKLPTYYFTRDALRQILEDTGHTDVWKQMNPDKG